MVVRVSGLAMETESDLLLLGERASLGLIAISMPSAVLSLALFLLFACSLARSPFRSFSSNMSFSVSLLRPAPNSSLRLSFSSRLLFVIVLSCISVWDSLREYSRFRS